MAWEAVIGLECHIQLKTRSKMFDDAPVAFGDVPNSNLTPVSLGLPGALPTINATAIDWAVRLGQALDCSIRERSVFARKHYFYPDMPKNYQITQFDQPLCEGGALPVVVGGEWRTFALTRIHLEEDAGKSFHPEVHGDRRVSRLDFNRAGTPLLELVTEPVLHAPAECAAFLTALRRLVRWLDISDADMEKGHLRCDANVSVRMAGESALGTKTELKNLNSIKGVEKGVAAEIERQIQLLESGGRVSQATLLYDAEHDKLQIMRLKESAQDYRYFPEPDLPVLIVTREDVERVRTTCPELPWVRERRLASQYGLPAYDTAVLGDSRELADYYEALACEVDGKLASNWLMTEVLRVLKERDWSVVDWATRVSAPRLAGLLQRVYDRTLPGPLAKQAFAWMADEQGTVAELLERHGVRVQASPEDLRPLVLAVLEENPGPVSQYLAGQTKTLGFLTGQVMKKSGGQAVPQTVQELLIAELASRPGT